jgi:UTP-glucose-1-phosphate uridylyltransferase
MFASPLFCYVCIMPLACALFPLATCGVHSLVFTRIWKEALEICPMFQYIVADVCDIQGTTQFTVTLSNSRYLVTDFNTGAILVSLNHTLQILLYYSTAGLRTLNRTLDFSIICQLPTP